MCRADGCLSAGACLHHLDLDALLGVVEEAEVDADAQEGLRVQARQLVALLRLDLVLERLRHSLDGDRARRGQGQQRLGDVEVELRLREPGEPPGKPCER